MTGAAASARRRSKRSRRAAESVAGKGRIGRRSEAKFEADRRRGTLLNFRLRLGRRPSEARFPWKKAGFLWNQRDSVLVVPCTRGPNSLKSLCDSRKVISMKQMSKSELIQTIADQHSGTLTRKDVKGIIESLASVGYKELKKSGAFVLPGFAKFVVVKKPATKARKGINPFTKEPTIFKAKPARKLIKARPVKAVKDAV